MTWTNVLRALGAAVLGLCALPGGQDSPTVAVRDGPAAARPGSKFVALCTCEAKRCSDCAAGRLQESST